MTHRITLAVLVLLVVVSALGVISSKQHSRQLYHQLQVLRNKQDMLASRWAQLQLEKGTWASLGRIEHKARQQHMHELRKYKVIQVTP